MTFSLDILFLFKLHMIENKKGVGRKWIGRDLKKRKVTRSFRHKVRFETFETSKRIGS